MAYEKVGHTIEAPHVSHLASILGNTGKSTAKMHMTVNSIMFARYTVSDGKGRMGICIWEVGVVGVWGSRIESRRFGEMNVV